MSLTRLGRASSGRVDAVNLLHAALGVSLESARGWGQHAEFQPGHRCGAGRRLWRILGRSGVVGFGGEVNAIVCGCRVEVENRRFGIGEVVLARYHQVAGEEGGVFAFGDRVGQGGGGQAGEDIGMIGSNTRCVVERCDCADCGRCCQGIGGVARIVLGMVSTIIVPT